MPSAARRRTAVCGGSSRGANARWAPSLSSTTATIRCCASRASTSSIAAPIAVCAPSGSLGQLELAVGELHAARCRGRTRSRGRPTSRPARRTPAPTRRAPPASPHSRGWLSTASATSMLRDDVGQHDQRAGQLARGPRLQRRPQHERQQQQQRQRPQPDQRPPPPARLLDRRPAPAPTAAQAPAPRLRRATNRQRDRGSNRS